MSEAVLVVVRAASAGDSQAAISALGRQAVRAGRVVADLLGDRLEVAIELPRDAEPLEDLTELEADAVLLLPWSGPEAGDETGRSGERLAALARERKVGTVVLPHSYEMLDLLGRLTISLDAAAVTEVVGVRAQGDEATSSRDLVWRKPVFNGRLTAEVAASAEVIIATVAAAFATGEAGGDPTRHRTPPPVEAVSQPALEHSARPLRELVAIERDEGELSLADAKRLVAVGRGLGGPEHLGLAQRLAQELDAELAASRPVVDAGWLPRARQVGSSGQSVGPELYLALGISGSSQHLQGLAEARCIVAVNTDERAPILRVARYAIVRDLHQVVPALLRALAVD